MGEGYRATDTKLGRKVAPKVLPLDGARDPERLARFRRDTRVIAPLDQPHIAANFSAEEADRVHFLTMELVDGLRQAGLGIAEERLRQIAGA